MYFDLVPAGHPASRRGRQFEIAAVILQGDVHGVFADDRPWYGTGHLFGRTTAEDLEPLIVLMKREYDKNSRSMRREPLCGFDRHDFVSALKSKSLLKIFCQRDGTKHTLRGRIEIVGLR